MFDPSVRSAVRHRMPRSVGVLLRGLAVAFALSVMPTALAQLGEIDPSCPPTAWCHPDGSGLSYMEDAASAGGSDMIRRRDEGDCTGLGPQGCLAVVLNQLLCVIDGRDWVQEYACASGPVETPPAGGGGAGGGGATPPADPPTPPAEEKPDPDPDAEPLVAVVAPGVGRWLRGELERTNAGERLARVRVGDRATLELIVWGRYERTRGDANAFFTVLRVIDSVDRRQRLIIVGVRGDLVYVGDVERLRAGDRRGATPNTPKDALAQGGTR